jgi:hypothetical protein
MSSDLLAAFKKVVITTDEKHVAKYKEEPVEAPKSVKKAAAAVASAAAAAAGAPDEEPEGPDGGDAAGDDSDENGRYYVHIDVRKVTGVDEEDKSYKRSALARHINKYMLRLFHYDPRRYHNFFDDVWAGEPAMPRPAEMRRAMGDMANSYYELWAVKAEFDLAAFYNSFEGLNFEGFTIKMCAMHGAQGHMNTVRDY